MRKVLIILLLRSLLLPLQAVELPQNVLSSIEEVLEQEAKSRKNGGISFSLSNEDQIIYSVGYGNSNKEDNKKMTPDTVSISASVTKLFTATAVMKLYQEGKLDIDKPISSYLPNFSMKNSSPEDFTLRLLLTHYSGLPSDFLKGYLHPWNGEGNATDYLPGFLSELSKEYSPGSAGVVYRYSNIGYELASAIIAEVSGISYANYIKQEILEPLDMRNSEIYSYKGLKKSVAKGYLNNKTVNPKFNRGSGDGDLLSTSNDLVKFGREFFSDEPEILSTNSMTTMFEKFKLDTMIDSEKYTAIGWSRMEVPGYPGKFSYYHHGGSTPYSSALFIIPELKMSFAIMGNEKEDTYGAATEQILQILFESSTGTKPITKKETGNKTEGLSKSLHGLYSTPYGTVTIGKKWNGSVMSLAGSKFYLTRDKNGFYGIQVRILGLIPLAIQELKAAKFKFMQGDQNTFIYYQGGVPVLMGSSLKNSPDFSGLWKTRIGDYTIVNPDKNILLEYFRIDFNEKIQQPVVKMKVSLMPMDLEFPLDCSKDDLATIRGLGRHLGDKILVEETEDRETLRYSGYLLKLKK